MSSEIVYIQGSRAKVISKNYQDGTCTIEFEDLPPMGMTIVQQMTLSELSKWEALSHFHTTDPVLNIGYFPDFESNYVYEPKCTCGNDSLRPSLRGKHSEGCEKYSKFD